MTEEHIKYAQKILDEMIEGCENIKKDFGRASDSGRFASLVIHDCNKVKLALKGERMPGDDSR